MPVIFVLACSLIPPLKTGAVLKIVVELVVNVLSNTTAPVKVAPASSATSATVATIHSDPLYAFTTFAVVSNARSPFATALPPPSVVGAEGEKSSIW